MIPLFFDFLLLNPLALFGLFSLAIPILIHLFNPNRAKLILIGNIELLKNIKRTRTIDIKIEKWILLLVRLAILFILTLILSDIYRNNKSFRADKHHIFVTQDWINNADELEKNQLFSQHFDSPVYLLAKNFPLLSQTKMIDNLSASIVHPNYLSIDTLVSELIKTDLIVANNTIYTTNRLTEYLSEHKTDIFQLPISWKIKQLELSELSSVQPNVSVYYSSSREQDLQYLKNALDFLNVQSSSKLNINYYAIQPINEINSPTDQPVNKADWFFWLSEHPVPENLLSEVKSGAYLFADIESQNKLDNKFKIKPSTIEINDFWIKFYSAPIDDSDNALTPVWVDNNDNSWLSYKQILNGRFYQFNSRFNSGWTNLVNTIQFPIILSTLITDSPILSKQKRVASSEIALFSPPVQLDSSVIINKTIPFKNSLLLILCALWLIERLISESRKLNNE